MRCVVFPVFGFNSMASNKKGKFLRNFLPIKRMECYRSQLTCAREISNDQKFIINNSTFR